MSEMASALRAYLEAKAARDAAHLVEQAALESEDDEVWRVAFDAYCDAADAFADAAVACLPPELAGLHPYWGSLGLPDQHSPSAEAILSALETAYVWIPLLASELDADRESAAFAFALGARPAKYPKDERD